MCVCVCEVETHLDLRFPVSEALDDVLMQHGVQILPSEFSLELRFPWFFALTPSTRFGR